VLTRGSWLGRGEGRGGRKGGREGGGEGGGGRGKGRETHIMRVRYEKMAEQEELNYQQQRRRMFAEVAQEKEKLAEQFQKQKMTSDLKLKEAADIHER
jgi:hypothetical protein